MSAAQPDKRTVRAVATVPGDAQGPALILAEPLSLWGGLDPVTGRIIDQHHPQCGVSLMGAVVFMPLGRGSSSASSVLAEAVRLGTAPAGFVLAEPDEIVALGALVGEELYGTTTPVVVCDAVERGLVETGDTVNIAPADTGRVVLTLGSNARA